MRKGGNDLSNARDSLLWILKFHYTKAIYDLLFGAGLQQKP
jgi:hypothetical protein